MPHPSHLSLFGSPPCPVSAHCTNSGNSPGASRYVCMSKITHIRLYWVEMCFVLATKAADPKAVKKNPLMLAFGQNEVPWTVFLKGVQHSASSLSRWRRSVVIHHHQSMTRRSPLAQTHGASALNPFQQSPCIWCDYPLPHPLDDNSHELQADL